MRDLVIPTLEKHSSLKAGTGFGLCFNPEFLREGTSVYDYYNPPKIVIGTESEADAEAMGKLYEGIEAHTIVTSLEVAEMVKYVDNTFHALKVCFGNEIGNVCKELGIEKQG